MDYLEIVLQGYFNGNNRDFLEKYFLRECKKAEMEYFEPEEFYSGCLKVVDEWEKNLQSQIHERKKELYWMLNDSKNKSDQESIDFFEQELKDVRPDGIGSTSFTVHLFSLTNGRIPYIMNYNDLMRIKIAIINAQLKIWDNEQVISPPPTDHRKPKLPERLEFIFKDVSKYKEVMEILVSKELIYPNTYFRNEKKCGKGLLCALLKDIEGKGYYKDEITMNYEICKEICKNTFKTTIGSNKTYYTELPPHQKGIIPIASTIN